MCRLLEAADREPRQIGLPAWLRELLSGGLVEDDGALLFRACAVQPGSGRDGFPDLTGYEASINHFHVDAAADGLDDFRIARVAVDEIAQLVDRSQRGQTVRIALSRNLAGPHVSSTVRFYRVRPGEVWLVDDLESYEQEAVGFMDIVPPPWPQAP